MNAESLRCAIRSTEPEGQCSSVGCHFSDIEIPMMDMYVRGIHFYTGRGQGRPNIQKAMALPDTKTRIEAMSVEPMATDPAALDAFFKSEVVRWTDVAKRAGLNAQ